MTGFEPTSHTTVGRAGYPLNHPGDVTLGHFLWESMTKGNSLFLREQTALFLIVHEKGSSGTLMNLWVKEYRERPCHFIVKHFRVYISRHGCQSILPIHAGDHFTKNVPESSASRVR